MDYNSRLSSTINDGQLKLRCSSYLEVLEGVAIATKISEEDKKPVALWISSYQIFEASSSSELSENQANTFSFDTWLELITSDFPKQNEDSKPLANLALCILFMREKGRQGQNVSGNSLTLVWGLIHEALTSAMFTHPLFTANRSAQGLFLVVPLCSLVKGGNIDQLFRLHVWLPNSQVPNPDYSIHSHQPFAQSWILAGEGKDHAYKIEPCADLVRATHAEFSVPWSKGKIYRTDTKTAPLENTGVLVHVTETKSSVHIRDMSYSIPAATFHKSEVPPDILHATLFFFDSHRGFVKEARVLGPKDGDSALHPRAPADFTPLALANLVEAVRSWEIFMWQGQQRSEENELEQALQAFNSALGLCESVENFPNVNRYKHMVLVELGRQYRRVGKYILARQILETALADSVLSPQRIEMSGELGVIYRHMNRFADAKHVLQIQYDTAKELHSEREVSRAIGNLGVVNYQLFLQNPDRIDLVKLAIEQLTERVESARRLKETSVAEATDSKAKAYWIEYYTIRECIALGRLSLCYTALGNGSKAISSAKKAIDGSKTSRISLNSMSHFHYARALKLNGEPEEAARLFRSSGVYSAAVIFLCREPSEEHDTYLRELVESGVDVDLTDDHGYTALDYTIFNGDPVAEELILQGLRQKMSQEEDLDNNLVQRLRDSKLRKGYRELFQEKLRPVLLGRGDRLIKLRKIYADALAASSELRSIFDEMKVVRYDDFLEFGSLPRSTDGLTKPLVSILDRDSGAEFIIFFSYRWINPIRGASPDDEQNTQYRRMLCALEDFLRLYPSVDRKRLSIWLDYACIDQNNPTSGVSALPINLAQCNAMISLVDPHYHSRAWCSVETLMIQTLKKSYNLHLWYEQIVESPKLSRISSMQNESMHIPSCEEEVEMGKWVLVDAPMDLEIVMKDKLVSFEEDRNKVMFLERQSKFFG